MTFGRAINWSPHPPAHPPTYIKLLQFALLICINLMLLYAQDIIDRNCVCSHLMNDSPVKLLHFTLPVLSLHATVPYELTTAGNRNISGSDFK